MAAYIFPPPSPAFLSTMKTYQIPLTLFLIQSSPSPASSEMASESETTQSQTRSVLERLITTRNRDLSLFLPFLLRLSEPDPDGDSPDPDRRSAGGSDPRRRSERIVLINPFTQGTVVVEGASLSSLLRVDPTDKGRPPASKAAIDALPTVEVGEGEVGECVICLEEWGFENGVAKEMPCKHRFHGDCIEKWLKIHGSCPVCRFEMPCDQEDGRSKSGGDGGEGRIWLSFTFSGNGGRDADRPSSGNDEHTASNGDSQQPPEISD